jgi:hypothetical protein
VGIERWGKVGLAVLVAAAVSASCGGRCSVRGCPPELYCSVLTDRCVPPEEVIGTSCELGEMECHSNLCLDGTHHAAICTALCNVDEAPCPDGLACLTVSHWTGFQQVCVPVEIIGARCSRNNDCGTGTCVNIHWGDDPICSATCDLDVPLSCGEGNVTCQRTIDVDTGAQGSYCVAGGEALPFEACPNGTRDCDLYESDGCLGGGTDPEDGFCAPRCPGGQDDCAGLDGCCQDLNGEPWCVPARYCPS